MCNQVIEREEEFHDKWAISVDLDTVLVDDCFEASTMPENSYLLSSLDMELKDKTLLELGCGLGEASVYFAKKGCIVTATDLSKGMLDVADKLSKRHGVFINTVKCGAIETPFDDDTFDIVYAANLLHHVDIESTLKEIKRVLKPNGILLSYDPLKYNPIINVYRRMAMSVRTEDEHPIKMCELKLFKKYFSNVEYKTFWFFTNIIFLKYYFIDKVDPNKERYWKKNYI